MGAILVARHASPQLTRVIHKAGGFITNVGSTSGQRVSGTGPVQRGKYN